MSVLFKLLGVLLAGYVSQSLVTGAVYAKSGVWGRTFTRARDALGYWSAIGAYTLLAVALVFAF